MMTTHSIATFCLVSVLVIACATEDKARDSGPSGSILERIPIVYRQDIQQGNVFDQRMVNQLHPGLSKRQVRFIMGSPMLVDLFHPSRWDYVYTMTHGWGDTQYKHLQIYFDNQDRLERIAGDLKPIPGSGPPIKQETMVSVPDYKDPNRGIIKQAVEKVDSLFGDESKAVKTTPTPANKPLPPKSTP